MNPLNTHAHTHTHTHTHTHLVAEVHLALEFVDGALQGDLTLLSKRSKALHPTYGYKLETAYANRGVRELIGTARNQGSWESKILPTGVVCN